MCIRDSHGGVEVVFLELVDVKLGLLHALADEDALALLMDFEHVFLRLRMVPAEHLLEDVGDVFHKIDGIIPANDQIARLQAGVRIGLA